MLTISQCKKILNKQGIVYSEEEVEKLRDVLYKLAEIIYNNDEQIPTK